MAKNAELKKIKKIFKDRLNETVNDAGGNKIKIAEDAKINRGTLKRYLDGEKLPGEELVKLAHTLDVSVSYLLGESDAKELDNIDISSKLGIDDDTIHNLEEIKEINAKYNNEYSNMLGKIFTDTSLYKNSIQKIDLYIKYHSDVEYKEEINKEMNSTKKKVIGLGRNNNIDIDDLIDISFYQKFMEVFHNYIDFKLIEVVPVKLGKSMLLDKKKKIQAELRKVNAQLKKFE